MCIFSPTPSEAMVASKQPQRSNDLRFDTSNHDYHGIHVHIASIGLQGHDGLWGHGCLQTTSEVIWPQIWYQQPWLPWYPCAYCLQRPSRPWRPPNDLGGHIWPRNSTQWPRLPMFLCLFCFQRPLWPKCNVEAKHDPLTCVASPQVIKQQSGILNSATWIISVFQVLQ